MFNAFDKLIAPLRRRVRLMVGRAVLSAASDSGGVQMVQLKLLADEVRDGVERMQNYGFTSVPLAGAEGVMVCVSGDRDHGIVVVMDDRRYRLKSLQPGEVAMYTDEGDTIVMKRGRQIGVSAGTKITATAPVVEIAASTKVTLTTPLVEMSQDLSVGGSVSVAGDVVAGGISLVTHLHSGVVSGGGNSGGPL